jgi:hypothetical protein
MIGMAAVAAISPPTISRTDAATQHQNAAVTARGRDCGALMSWPA